MPHRAAPRRPAAPKPGARGRWHALRARVLAISAPSEPASARMTADDARAFDASLDHNLAQLLPVIGPAFSAVLILFGAWDYWIDAHHAGATVRIRVILALAGMPAYLPLLARWGVSGRCAHLYATHAGAMVIAATLLDGGLLLALPVIAASMFPLALVEPRLWRCLAAMLPHSLLFIAAAIWKLPALQFWNAMLLYLLSLLLASVVAVALGRLRRSAFMAEKALLYALQHDSLSGALSRKHLFETAEHDLQLARRHARPLAVALLDIDHFKSINDRHGHAVGDKAIRALVSTCQSALRASDYIGRVGGEEFVCVMPETDASDALACAQRVREQVAAMRLALPEGTLQFTVSIGLCMLDQAHQDLATLLQAADGAMYSAKAAGRNRVAFAADQTPRP